MTNFIVTRAMIEDVDSVVPLFNSYRIFYGMETDLDGARAFILERLSNDESAIFLAKAEGKALGFVQLYPSFSSISMCKTWILNDLYVLKEARKLGVGSQLMYSARQFAVQTKAKSITLETDKDNITAQSLYEKLHYKKDEGFHYTLHLE